MSLDARKKQKKAEKRAKKQRQRRVISIRGTGSVPAQYAQAAKVAPVLHSFISGELSSGMTNAVLSRPLPGNRVACAVFLVDTFCLGVKNVQTFLLDRASYDAMIDSEQMTSNGREKVSPQTLRALVEGAVAYAEAIGFSPARKYAQAALIFGDTDPAESDEKFTFGKDGKPFFIAGPYDSMGRSMWIVDRLNKFCGEGNFDYLVPLTDENSEIVFGASHHLDDWDEDEETDDDNDVDEAAENSLRIRPLGWD